jgi:hypothetical protein
VAGGRFRIGRAKFASASAEVTDALALEVSIWESGFDTLSVDPRLLHRTHDRNVTDVRWCSSPHDASADQRRIDHNVRCVAIESAARGGRGGAHALGFNQ